MNVKNNIVNKILKLFYLLLFQHSMIVLNKELLKKNKQYLTCYIKEIIFGKEIIVN